MKITKWFCLLAVLMTSCNAVDQKSTLKQDVIENLTRHIVIPTYFDLYQDAQNLNSNIQAIQLGDEGSFLKAKEAWAKARDSWERSEGFLFGPVEFEEIDPALDSWPVDVTAIQEILESDAVIDQDLIEKNPEARGFHLIEFLLWGADQNKTASMLSEREFAFLKIASLDFEENTRQLYHHWEEAEKPFKALLLSAKDHEQYSSDREVIMEFVEGIVALADEVANEKIAGPLQETEGFPAPYLQESFFSDLSKNDLINNITSISNVYLGSYTNHKGLGLSSLVQVENPKLDVSIQNAILEASRALSVLPDSFTLAIHENRSEVKEAQIQVQALHDLLIQLVDIQF